jgi:hypothetical protein
VKTAEVLFAHSAGNGKIDYMEFEKGINFLTWGLPK